jgi:hypothetical protein
MTPWLSIDHDRGRAIVRVSGALMNAHGATVEPNAEFEIVVERGEASRAWNLVKTWARYTTVAVPESLGRIALGAVRRHQALIDEWWAEECAAEAWRDEERQRLEREHERENEGR